MRTAAGTGAQAGDSVLKHDLAAGRTTQIGLGAGRLGSEFVFVPSAPDAAEDDGVLMGFSYDTATDRTDLTILDAATGESVGAVHLPARVPHGFHGNWAPAQG
jgi:carotenoid cleavage dioxygenase